MSDVSPGTKVLNLYHMNAALLMVLNYWFRELLGASPEHRYAIRIQQVQNIIFCPQ
jgi:hypothetical protein